MLNSPSEATQRVGWRLVMPNLVKAIKSYHRLNRIEPANYEDFRCPNKESCRAGCSKLTTGNEPFLGSKYEERLLPRLLFVSAEAYGGNAKDPKRRTVEGHRRSDGNEIETMSKRRAGGHWFKTTRLARWILAGCGKKTFADQCSYGSSAPWIKDGCFPYLLSPWERLDRSSLL